VPESFRNILGVRFYAGDLPGLLERIRGGGLVAVPSAPVMTRLTEDEAHREALEGADFAVTDSSFMVLLWLLRTGERLTRISGLRVLRALVADGDYRGRSESFWIMPSSEDSAANLAWLRGQGFDVSEDDAYVAPLYSREGPIADEALVARLAAIRPRLVVVALSGGVQERLGWLLRQSLGYRPAILCIGGAIAFLSGRQTRIPTWADRLAIGWVLRFLSSPRSFARKLRGVQKLPGLIWTFGPASVSGRR
jgi:N-acetylglucosaminyldiphosphoundecaprenol N-acetyl-beta-D-mannosaminyltransferase